MLRTLIMLLAAAAEEPGAFYDCPLREIASAYTRQVILKGWDAKSSTAALALVSKGLRLDQCNTSAPAPPAAAAASASASSSPPTAAAGVAYYVATTGSDGAAGTAALPLATIAGAQAKIRAAYPIVSERPPITVFIGAGDYFYGAAGPDHLQKATRYSSTASKYAMAVFGGADSGASAAAPITYTAAPGAATAPRFLGGVALKGLSFAAAAAGAGLPAGVLKATVPGDVSFDVQDQLFVLSASGTAEPLVRGRTPNGRPWIPLDGFNLTVHNHFGGLAGPDVYSHCSPQVPNPPNPGPPPAPRPNRPVVPKGGCVSAPNTTLLNGIVLPTPKITPTLAACAAFCQADKCCHGYTWHDDTTGGYYQQCYLIASEDDPWASSQPSAGHQSGLCDHNNATCPADVYLNICKQSTVVCGNRAEPSNLTQVIGSVGTVTASGKALAGAGNDTGLIEIEHCLEHLLDLANDWPSWESQSYGVMPGQCNFSDPLSCVNTMDTTYNYPMWFGPWAGGIEVDQTQDPAIRGYSWADASDVVVHAMADGEWGGTQFRVASVEKVAGSANPQLTFSMGGFQQARGAMLGAGTNMQGSNRFYMEGALEMLDAPGEWHFDAAKRELYVFPLEASSSNTTSSMSMDLLLTQTDTIFAFEGSSSESRVEHIVLANLSIGHTSAQFFRPHEETSGGDYATHRSGAVKLENATGIQLLSNSFTHVGGNAVFLSNSVRNNTVSRNTFQWLGTSGVAVQGKTGGAMMDGRDGEMLMAAHGPDADNGVRLPKHNLVSNNVFADYGIWDKQSACYHKALAPGNMFLNNVCFNSSRHGVNFQDGFGGGGIAEGNLMFNLNRETSDTTAFNSWNRRNYITSPSSGDPAVGILVPETPNEWRRNLILGRDYYGIRDSNGNGLRNDDGASNYLHSNNVIYGCGGYGMEFNGGTQIHTVGNLFIQSGWSIGPTPDVASSFYDTFVDNPTSWTDWGGAGCAGFWNTTGKGPGKINTGTPKPGIYTGDYSLGVVNSTGQGTAFPASSYYCGLSLEQWQANTNGQDLHSTHSSNADGRHGTDVFLAKARAMLFKGQ